MFIISKTIFYYAVFILLILPAQTFAISMHCVTVGPTGDVTVTWDATGTSNINFRSWHVYHSTIAAGPYTLIDSLNLYNPTSDNDPNANAASIPAYYYVVFKSNNGSPDILSDTIRAIGLIVNNPANGYANLLWSPTHTPLISTNSIYYLIYREYPAAVFTLIDSVNASTSPIPMTYTDEITICDDTIKYRIEVMDATGCISVSSLKGDRFHDFLPPSIPLLDSVSVDLAGNATVTWQVSSSPDTKSYIILQNPGNIVIDTVFGHNSTTLSTTINAQNGSESFFILAVDSCNNPTSPSSTHSTIYLQASFDFCTQSASLIWTPYNFWGTPIVYNVFVSINGAPETFVGSSTQTNFSDTNLISGSNFCYRVQVAEVTGTRTSTSNRSCIAPGFPPPPAFSYLRKVTVVGQDQVYIEAYVDPATPVKGYKLMRSTSAAGPFSIISSVNITGVSTVSFTDNVPVDKGPYYYMITTFDSCGRNVLSSQVSNTMLLKGAANIDFTNSINWNDYAAWPAGVGHYNIYLSNNGTITSLPIATVSTLTTAYLDSIIDNIYSDGNFCYIIEAVEAPGNPNFFLDTSRSNELCLAHQPIIFIPNAFHPGGYFNEIFYPSNGFVPTKDYSLDIYNRWGENVFHTNDPYVGWSGTYKGNLAQEAVYIYRLKSKNPDGSDIDLVGSVTLIR